VGRRVLPSRKGKRRIVGQTRMAGELSAATWPPWCAKKKQGLGSREREPLQKAGGRVFPHYQNEGKKKIELWGPTGTPHTTIARRGSTVSEKSDSGTSVIHLRQGGDLINSEPRRANSVRPGTLARLQSMKTIGGGGQPYQHSFWAG